MTSGGSIEPKTDDFCALRGERVQRYVWVLDFVKNQRVVDFGCGHGLGSAYLAANGAISVLGVDSDESAIRFSRRTCHRENLRFELMDAERSSLPAERFDVAVSFEVLEHVNSAEAFLAGIRDTVRRGGKVILSTPNKRITEQTYRHGRSLNPYHIREYYPEELWSLVSRDFRLERMYGQACLTMTAEQQVRSLQWQTDCRIPRSLRRIVPRRLKNLWMRTRGVPVLDDTSGMWRDFVIREVEDFAEFARDFPVQLVFCTRE